MSKKCAMPYTVGTKVLEDYKKKCADDNLSMNTVMESLMKFYIADDELKKRLKSDAYQKKTSSVPIDEELYGQ